MSKKWKSDSDVGWLVASQNFSRTSVRAVVCVRLIVVPESVVPPL